MKVFKTITVSLCGLALLFGFNNCAKSNLSSKALNFSSLNVDPEDQGEHLGDPNRWCKVSLASAGQTTKIFPELTTKNFDTGTKLMVVADGNCLRTQDPKTWLSQQLLSKMGDNNAAQISGQVLPPGPVTAAQLEQIAQTDSCILTIDEDANMDLFSVPNDPSYATGQPYLTSIMHSEVAPSLYNLSNGITKVITVAVLDSGLDVNHPDIKDQIARDLGGNIMSLNAMDNTNNVYDSGFHGTHVAGLIAATADNEIGISGVMGKSVRILPIKVSANGTAVDMSAVVNGIYWAADNGADVINMSLGGPTERPTLKEAIAYAIDKGVFIVAASGNNGRTLSSAYKIYPAMYGSEFEGMMTIGSYDSQTQAVSSFSNISPSFVELMAPGSHGTTGILSTVPANLSATGYASKINQNGSMYAIQGTSMATPLAAGSAALAIGIAKSRGYDVHPAQVEKIMNLGATKYSAYSSSARSGNRLNLNTLIDKVDADMALDISSTQSGSLAKGTLQIQTHPQNISVASAESFELKVTLSASSSTFLNYQWYKNNKPLLAQKNPTLKIQSSNSSHSGVYHVELTAGSTKVSSQSATVKINGDIEGCP